MFRKLCFISVTTFSALVTLTAHADRTQENEAQQAIALSAGSFGLGLEYTYKLTPTWYLRGGIYGADVDEAELEVSGNEYEGDAESFAAGIFVDWHPHQQGWARHLFYSAGVITFNGEYRGEAQSTFGDSLRVGNMDVPPSAGNQLQLHMEYDDQVTPFVGIGFGNNLAQRGFSFTGSVGLIYVEEPDVSLSFSQTVSQQLMDAAAAEREDIIDDSHGVAPYASLGVSYRF